MLDRLHSDVHVLARQTGADASQLAALAARFPALPATFLELFAGATELELSYRGIYLRFYGPSGCVEMDQAYGISTRIPGAIVVGDNGGGEAVVFMPTSPGPGLFRVGYGALAVDELVSIAPSLEALLVHGLPDPGCVGACQT